MRASFDGARRNLAGAYNDLANDLAADSFANGPEWIQFISDMNNLQAAVGGLLCMYDDDVDDCNDLSDKSKLKEVS